MKLSEKRMFMWLILGQILNLHEDRFAITLAMLCTVLGLYYHIKGDEQ